MGAGPIRALTGGRRTKPTSTGCRRLRQPEPGRRSTYQAGGPVQTNRASSDGQRAGGIKTLQDSFPPPATCYLEETGDTQATSVSLFLVLKAASRRWKLVSAVAVSTLA